MSEITTPPGTTRLFLRSNRLIIVRHDAVYVLCLHCGHARSIVVLVMPGEVSLLPVGRCTCMENAA